jgi:hypothetical protein
MSVSAPLRSWPRSLPEQRRRLDDLLRSSPALPLLLLATGVFVWFAGDEGGFNPTTFLLGGLFLLGLLAVGLIALPLPQPPRPLLISVALLVAFAGWSYLSITWAGDKGTAWDGANRTVIYAIVFALFALWPMRSDVAVLLLGVYGVAIAGVALVELLKAGGASQSVQYFHEGRLAEPTGYVNANVALCFSAFWPCLILSSRREVAAPLRGLFLGSAGLLASVAVLGESRGWFLTLPLMVILAVVLVPGRGRTIVSMAVLAGAILVIRRPLLDVYEHWHALRPPGQPLEDATRAILIVSGALAVLGFAAALVDRRVRLGATPARRISAAFVVLFVLACLGGVAGYAVVKGNPVSAASKKWKEFKKAGTEPEFKGSRFGLAVSSYRYDYWRVAWQDFTRHPFKGVGVDNYERSYLLRGKIPQSPKYPHSTEIRALSETGLVGGLLFFGALGAALVAAFPALRRPGLGASAGAAALMLFSYFLVHGALDWLWEFAGLGAPAFAALGIAAALGAGRSEPAKRLPGGRLAGAALVLAGLAAAVGMALPWLAARDLAWAQEHADQDPARAVDRLDRAAKLNPLSTLAYETAALIELRTMREPQAKAHLRKAIDRDPGQAFPYLELGAVASLEGQKREALRLIRRAHGLAPRDGPTTTALSTVERGKKFTPERLERLVRSDIDARIGPE